MHRDACTVTVRDEYMYRAPPPYSFRLHTSSAQKEHLPKLYCKKPLVLSSQACIQMKCVDVFKWNRTSLLSSVCMRVKRRYPTGAKASAEWMTVSIESLKHTMMHNHLFFLFTHTLLTHTGVVFATYITIFFLKSGQSMVKVSYSPPSPQIWTPYFSESCHKQSHIHITGTHINYKVWLFFATHKYQMFIYSTRNKTCI